MKAATSLKYTQELARVCEKMGAKFLYGTQVTALGADRFSKRVHAVEVSGSDGYRNLRARDIVVSLGCWSAPMLRPYGVRLNIYPAKGYSVTIPIEQSNAAPVTSLTDDEYKLVYSNLGGRLRVAGTAELSGYSRNLDIGRCEAIVRHARNLFPRAGDFSRATYWTGLRPATSSNIPVSRPHALSQSLAQYRPWHAGLDARRRFGIPDCEYDRGERGAGGRLILSMIFSENRFPPRIKSGAGFSGSCFK